MEEWKDINGYEGLYQVSNLGNVKSIRRNKTLKQGNVNGYRNVILSKNGKTNGKLVHRLVAEAFIKNPNNFPQVNHIDENRFNNCVYNLEWCTSEYNINYSQSKPILQYDLEGNFIKEWKSSVEIKRSTGFYTANISKCCLNKKYRKTAYGYVWRFK